jgi:hypothetical protein
MSILPRPPESRIDPRFRTSACGSSRTRIRGTPDRLRRSNLQAHESIFHAILSLAPPPKGSHQFHSLPLSLTVTRANRLLWSSDRRLIMRGAPVLHGTVPLEYQLEHRAGGRSIGSSQQALASGSAVRRHLDHRGRTFEKRQRDSIS